MLKNPSFRLNAYSSLELCVEQFLSVVDIYGKSYMPKNYI